MTPIGGMAGISILSWFVAATVLDRQTSREILFGMLGPLAVAIGAWMLMERTYRRQPERLTGVMAMALVGKMVFFGAYIVVMLRVLSLRTVPFVVSFTSYFIGLLVIQALALRRLLASRTPASGPPIP